MDDDDSILPLVCELEVMAVDDMPMEKQVLNNLEHVHDDIFITAKPKKRTRKPKRTASTLKQADVAIKITKIAKSAEDTAKDLTEAPKPKSRRDHLDSIRDKAIQSRYGTPEERAEKKRLKEVAKQQKKEERDNKRAEKLKLNREKARQRYWDKKVERELNEQKISNKPPPAEPQHLDFDTFSKYMTKYESQRPKAVSTKAPPPPTIRNDSYPSLFNHLDGW